MNYKNMLRIMAMVMSASIALTPVTAFANEASDEVVVEETVEAEATEDTAEAVVTEDAVEVVTEEAAETITEESTENTAEELTEVTEETAAEETEAETIDEAVAVDETADVISEEAVEEAVTEADDKVAADAVTTPALDKKALKILNDAASYQESLGNNSFKTGLAATNQVERCRNLAKNLLVYKLNYMDGMLVIGTAYDMMHGDNNYIRVDYKDVTTGEIFEKYYDFYMQDSQGNNVTNALKYHTVDRITIVEKGALTGEKKIAMYAYPTFESKSNGTVVFDYDSYSKLISQEYRDAVSATIR
ncbi:hypothetical protein [Butyrivibrio sp. INlla14]|uniref:hypothetical protein n=1 Tax=Butyrivibrio sp. INlla14 TaxID=1520808 RepID=UPI000875F95D|nr:hypothetical protein [Butyrivibrio sp. INlla14]SCY53022.1 hypothetical protein SAMN02910371_02659 [Butyrivibrio sp. INlla14]